MSPDVLARGGILRAPEVVELAARAGLELACAAVLLEKESGGGRNVWGHDDVPTGGAYDKGGAVTRDNYTAYRRALASGTAGRQGCGPCQLTYGAYQDAADRAGGCWDWRANCATGFGVLASLVRHHGVEAGFAAYNGAGPAAVAYGADAMTRLTRWRTLLASAPLEDDVALTDDEIDRIGKRTADLIMARPTANYHGDVVALSQIVNGIEQRVADLQSAATAPGGVDLDVLAGRLVALLAARIGAAAKP